MAEEEGSVTRNCSTHCYSFNAEYIPLQKYDWYIKRYDGFLPLGPFSKDFSSLYDWLVTEL